MFTRLPDGDMPTFVDVAIEFLLSVANVSWCWLFVLVCHFHILEGIKEREVRKKAVLASLNSNRETGRREINRRR